MVGRKGGDALKRKLDAAMAEGAPQLLRLVEDVPLLLLTILRRVRTNDEQATHRIVGHAGHLARRRCTRTRRQRRKTVACAPIQRTRNEHDNAVLLVPADRKATIAESLPHLLGESRACKFNEPLPVEGEEACALGFAIVKPEHDLLVHRVPHAAGTVGAAVGDLARDIVGQIDDNIGDLRPRRVVQLVQRMARQAHRHAARLVDGKQTLQLIPGIVGVGLHGTSGFDHRARFAEQLRPCGRHRAHVVAVDHAAHSTRFVLEAPGNDRATLRIEVAAPVLLLAAKADRRRRHLRKPGAVEAPGVPHLMVVGSHHHNEVPARCRTRLRRHRAKAAQQQHEEQAA